MSKISIEALEQKDKLLSDMQSVILATTDKDGAPNSSYAPSVIGSDGSLYIYISELSKHTLNLVYNSNVSLMIIEDESSAENLFARKRLTISAEASEIERDSDNWIDKMSLLEDKFGEAISYLRNLTDFRLFRLVPSQNFDCSLELEFENKAITTQ